MHRTGDNSNVTLLRRSSSQLTQSELSPDCHWKGRARYLRRFARETVRANRRHSREVCNGNSGSPRESRSEHRSGSEHDGSSVSGPNLRANDPELRRRITSQHHDTRVAGHPGCWKTLSSSPATTGATDVPLHWPICENMRPLSPDRFNDAVQPESFTHSHPGEPLGCHQCGFHCGTSRLAWVRRSHECGGLSGKRAHFIPTNTTITALGAARLFLHNVWKLHGLPRRVVSDRGPQFVRSSPESCTGCSYHTVNDHGLSTHRRWTDGTCQPRLEQYLESL